jgi:hypothetical protein
MIETTDSMIVSMSVVTIIGLFFLIRYATIPAIVNVSDITIDKYKDL